MFAIVLIFHAIPLQNVLFSEQELNIAINALLGKSGESNNFFKQDVEQSLTSILNHINSVKAMGAFISQGAG